MSSQATGDPAGAVQSVAPATHSLILGRSQSTCDLRLSIEKIAVRSSTVLVVGETGVGKEVTARQIHLSSPRSQQPFVPVDCTAFSAQLIESQLFGHVKGAFTGAISAAEGFLRCADRGTLFLDEIGELPLSAQGKLLRCIQERTVVPVGGTESLPIDVRFISATHRDLAAMVRDGHFREDLYYRLNVVKLAIPPLRERPDDILPLAHHFLDELASFYEEPAKELAPAAERRLAQFDWPGNVRQLRNAVERAFLYANGRTIEVADLPEEIRLHTHTPTADNDRTQSVPSLAESERMLIARALKASRGNQAQAARTLNVERHRLRRMIFNHHLEHLLRGRGR